MTVVKSLFGNYFIIAPAVAWITAQIIKVFTGMFKERKFNLLTLLFSNGGMPSSHSSAVCALATASVIRFGVASFECALCGLLAIIVMMDASGVRYETGEQAKIINRITKELFSGKTEEINTGLKELVGHTHFQVFMGALLGVAVAILLSFVM
ncbi:MAG: divergent PAP2 family protein [Clostridia bacterium]|nr:divergent PAP2 family protein [Clostridia bacterium]